METKDEKTNMERTGIPVDHFTDYLDNFYKINVLKAAAKASTIGAGLLSAIIIFSLSMLALILVFMGIAWWIGDVLNNRLAGCLLVALFLLILVFVLILLRKKVMTPIFKNWIIRKIYD